MPKDQFSRLGLGLYWDLGWRPFELCLAVFCLGPEKNVNFSKESSVVKFKVTDKKGAGPVLVVQPSRPMLKMMRVAWDTDTGTQKGDEKVAL